MESWTMHRIDAVSSEPPTPTRSTVERMTSKAWLQHTVRIASACQIRIQEGLRRQKFAENVHQKSEQTIGDVWSVLTDDECESDPDIGPIQMRFRVWVGQPIVADI